MAPLSITSQENVEKSSVCWCVQHIVLCFERTAAFLWNRKKLTKNYKKLWWPFSSGTHVVRVNPDTLCHIWTLSTPQIATTKQHSNQAARLINMSSPEWGRVPSPEYFYMIFDDKTKLTLQIYATCTTSTKRKNPTTSTIDNRDWFYWQKSVFGRISINKLGQR